MAIIQRVAQAVRQKSPSIMDEFKGRPISTTSYTDIDETPRSGRRADTADLAEFFKNTAPPPVARKPIAEPVEDPAPAYSHRRRNLPRRTLLILIAVVGACLLALIIGLAVGLTRNHHKNLPLPTTHGGPFTGDLTYVSLLHITLRRSQPTRRTIV